MKSLAQNNIDRARKQFADDSKKLEKAIKDNSPGLTAEEKKALKKD